MKFTYREFANDMARAAFTTDFSVDSKEVMLSLTKVPSSK